jgi:hypothetical protein
VRALQTQSACAVFACCVCCSLTGGCIEILLYYVTRLCFAAAAVCHMSACACQRLLTLLCTSPCSSHCAQRHVVRYCTNTCLCYHLSIGPALKAACTAFRQALPGALPATLRQQPEALEYDTLLVVLPRQGSPPASEQQGFNSHFRQLVFSGCVAIHIQLESWHIECAYAGINR